MSRAEALPLSGLRVLNPRPQAQAGPLSAALREAGADVIELPLLAIEPLPQEPAGRALLLDLDRYQGVLFVSVNAARLGLEAVADIWPQWPSPLAVCAVGQATRRVLADAGLSVQSPAREDSEGLLALPVLRAVSGQRWLLFRGDEGRELLAETLRERGARVDVLPLYRRRLPADAAQGWQALPAPPDIVLISSARVWRHWQQLAGSSALRPVLVAVSERVATLLREAGARQVLCADGAGPQGWVEALCRWRRAGTHGIQ